MKPSGYKYESFYVLSIRLNKVVVILFLQMGTNKPLSSPSKWFANKNLKLSFLRRRSKSSSSSALSSSPGSPISPPRTPKTTIVRTNREDELQEVFRYFDGNGDGKISTLELRAYFGSVREYISHEEAQEVINDFDSDGDGLIDFKDFLKLMNKEAGGDDKHGEDLKQAFEIFELEKGCLTPKSLQRMFGRLGDTKSFDECAAMIQVFDIDGNGVLDFNEFQQMMTASY